MIIWKIHYHYITMNKSFVSCCATMWSSSFSSWSSLWVLLDRNARRWSIIVIVFSFLVLTWIFGLLWRHCGLITMYGRSWIVDKLRERSLWKWQIYLMDHENNLSEMEMWCKCKVLVGMTWYGVDPYIQTTSWLKTWQTKRLFLKLFNTIRRPNMMFIGLWMRLFILLVVCHTVLKLVVNLRWMKEQY